ncbi:MAG: pyridoxamine 5'-phosphate oxidase family protein [Burkholderiales bacterium]
MRSHIQGSTELTRLARIVEDVSVAMLTTRDDDGNMASRPIALLEMDAQGALWFFTDLRSSTVEHLQAVNLSITKPLHPIYVSIAGFASLHTARADIDRLWTPLSRPWFPAGADSPHLALLKIVPQSVELWDSAHSKMVLLLARADPTPAVMSNGTSERAGQGVVASR